MYDFSNNDRPQDRLLKLREVAEFLGVHRNTASKFVRQHRIPFVQTGRRNSLKGRRWWRSTIIEMIAD
jgi:excisionase family DNA binding protein